MKIILRCIVIATLLHLAVESDRVKRVIGGGYSHRGQWPWLVSLQAQIITRRFMGIFPIEQVKIYCGGALITSQWVLTATHCFMPDGDKVPRGANDPSNWKARLGTVDLNPDFRDRVMHALGRLLRVTGWLQVERRVKLIATHPLYSSMLNWNSDIALVKLSRPVRGYRNIRPIMLPRHGLAFPSPGHVCVVKGWGCSSEGGRVSGIMRHVNLTVYNNGMCSRLYHVDMQTRICAGVAGSSICEGDSGGPLVCAMHGRWVHAGIASFTHQTLPQLYPSVFTKTSAFTNWIKYVVTHY